MWICFGPWFGKTILIAHYLLFEILRVRLEYGCVSVLFSLLERVCLFLWYEILRLANLLLSLYSTQEFLFEYTSCCSWCYAPIWWNNISSSKGVVRLIISAEGLPISDFSVSIKIDMQKLPKNHRFENFSTFWRIERWSKGICK